MTAVRWPLCPVCGAQWHGKSEKFGSWLKRRLGGDRVVCNDCAIDIAMSVWYRFTPNGGASFWRYGYMMLMGGDWGSLVPNQKRRRKSRVPAHLVHLAILAAICEKITERMEVSRPNRRWMAIQRHRKLMAHQSCQGEEWGSDLQARMKRYRRWIRERRALIERPSRPVASARTAAAGRECASRS